MHCTALVNSGIFIVNLKVMYMCIFVYPQSPPTVKKKEKNKKNPAAYRRRTCSCALMQTHRGTDMHGHSRITDTKTDVCTHTHTHTGLRPRCTHDVAYAWTNRLASKHRCEPTDVNAAAHLEERVGEQSASSSAVGSTRHSEALFRALRTCQSRISIMGQGQDGGLLSHSFPKGTIS